VAFEKSANHERDRAGNTLERDMKKRKEARKRKRMRDTHPPFRDGVQLAGARAFLDPNCLLGCRCILVRVWFFHQLRTSKKNEQESPCGAGQETKGTFTATRLPFQVPSTTWPAQKHSTVVVQEDKKEATFQHRNIPEAGKEKTARFHHQQRTHGARPMGWPPCCLPPRERKAAPPFSLRNCPQTRACATILEKKECTSSCPVRDTKHTHKKAFLVEEAAAVLFFSVSHLSSNICLGTMCCLGWGCV